MKELKIAVLGATGAVGQEMLKILEEYDIPVAELRPLASARSAGALIKFKGRDVAIQAATEIPMRAAVTRETTKPRRAAPSRPPLPSKISAATTANCRSEATPIHTSAASCGQFAP